MNIPPRQHLHLALAATVLGLVVPAGCVSTPEAGPQAAAPAGRAAAAPSGISKDTPTWVVFPDRKDLPRSDAIIRDPTFRLAVPVKQTKPDVSAACPAGKYTAWVMFVVEADGSVGDAVVVESSGQRAVDNACIECVRKWRFRPGMFRGEPIPTATEVPFDVLVAVNYRSEPGIE